MGEKLSCVKCGKQFREGPFDRLDLANIGRFVIGDSDCDPRLCESCCEGKSPTLHQKGVDIGGVKIYPGLGGARE